MYGCESWTVKKAERRRIDAFELWCWRSLLRVPWTSRRSNQSIAKGDQPWVFFGRNDAKAETPVLWPSCEELTHWKRLWCWEGLGAGGKGDDRGWDGCMASPTRWTWVWVNSGSLWWTRRPGVLRFMGSQRVGHNWATELNWRQRLPQPLGTGCKEPIILSYMPHFIRVSRSLLCLFFSAFCFFFPLKLAPH